MHLRKVHGIDVPKEVRADLSSIQNISQVRVADILTKTHPPNPLFTIPIIDAVIVCRFLGVDPQEFCIDVLPDLVFEMNKKITEKPDPFKKEEWRQ